MTPVLEARQLACRRGDRLIFTALDFRFGGGTLVLLRGANGCGKTSLLRLAAGLAAPASGKLTWRGRALWGGDFSPLWLGEDDGLTPELTVRENLRFNAALAGQPADDSLLARLKLSHVADRPCSRLSAGQRRRLAIADLWLKRSPLWLLDEAEAHLDEDGLTLLLAALHAHQKRGGVALIAAHRRLDLAAASVLALASYHPQP